MTVYRLIQLDAPLSLCLVFYALVLADGFAVFHGHLGLVGPHFFALSGMVKQKSNSLFQMLPLQACLVSVRRLSPFLDKFELHSLLLLHGGQELLEVIALLCDMAVLHLLLLIALAADEL